MTIINIKLGRTEQEKTTFIFPNDIADSCIENAKEMFEIELLKGEKTVYDKETHISILLSKEKRDVLEKNLMRVFVNQFPEINLN